jgi:hypothetical protein
MQEAQAVVMKLKGGRTNSKRDLNTQSIRTPAPVRNGEKEKKFVLPP